MTTTAEALPIERFDQLDIDILSVTIHDVEVAQQALLKLKAAGHSGFVDVDSLDYGRLPAEPGSLVNLYPPSLEELPDVVEEEIVLAAAPRDLDYEHFRDVQVVTAAQRDAAAMERLIQEYTPFIRRIASDYFVAGGDSDDVIQEGLLGLYKAARDYNGQSSFRNFVRLCASRQIIAAVKTATRFKHGPLNNYVSFAHTPTGQEGEDCTVGDALPGPAINDPVLRVISTEELQSLVGCLGSVLSPLESDVLRLYLEGSSYADMAAELGCDEKTIDNALQRTKRKIGIHQKAREVLQ